MQYFAKGRKITVLIMTTEGEELNTTRVTLVTSDQSPIANTTLAVENATISNVSTIINTTEADTTTLIDAPTKIVPLFFSQVNNCIQNQCYYTNRLIMNVYIL